MIFFIFIGFYSLIKVHLIKIVFYCCIIKILTMNHFDYKFFKYKIEFEVYSEHNENPKFIESANGYSIIA